MSKHNYSISLNFFIPSEIAKKLSGFEFKENVLFDWRDSNLIHCTIKAICLSDYIPDKEVLNSWVTLAKNILSKQKPFKIKIEGISSFPNTSIFAKVYSVELIDLHNKLCKLLPSSFPKFEYENYSPHVSIITLDKLNYTYAIKNSLGEFDVKEIQLMIWDLKDINNSKIYKKFELK